MPATKYIWDVVNDSYLMETDGNGATTAVYTNKPNAYGRLISQRRNGATSYHHFDGQPSTRELTDASEAVTDTYTYKAFGETVASSGTTTNPFRYVGRLGYYHDTETSDYYIRARKYDAPVGRFSSPNPLGFVAGDVNVYRYADNAPSNRTDPTGLQTCDPPFWWSGPPFSCTRAGWPRVIAHPGLPQIRTCRFPASGSSSDPFASQAVNGVDGHNCREAKAFLKSAKPTPRSAIAATATNQPLAPDAGGLLTEPAQQIAVPGDAVVGIVPTKLLA